MRLPPPVDRSARVALTLSAALIVATASCTNGSRDGSGDRAASRLELIQSSEVLDTLAREPMLVQHPSGAIFATGYNRIRPRLWKSTDLGATWSEVNVGLPRDGAVGNSDVDLAVAPDGTLYFVQMTFDLQKGEGVQLAVGVSRDGGAKWTWQIVTRMRYSDRPWIEVTPNGAAHLIWNDGSGVLHVVSRDRGETWSAPSRVHDRGGSSHLAVGPHGELAVHIIPGARSGGVCDEGTDLIALSRDDGATWHNVPAAGTARPPGCLDRENEMQRWVDPIAFDSTGALFALWTDSTGVWLGRASGEMASWTSWRVVERQADSLGVRNGPTPFFPYLAARGAGELAATWVLATKDTLQWQAARIVTRGDSAPVVTVSPAMMLEYWRNGGPDPGGEYLATAFLNDGSIGVVVPIQHDAKGRMGFGWRRFGVRR